MNEEFPLRVNKGNIWTYKQNKPSLIVNDFYQLFGVPPEYTAKILLARGVAKWFAVRRNLIRLKNQLADSVRYFNENKVPRYVRNQKGDWEPNPRYWYQRGAREAMESVRKEIRLMCHSDRWQGPDFDEKFRRMMEELDGN